jgi:hypothetical protein
MPCWQMKDEKRKVPSNSGLTIMAMDFDGF